MPRLRTPDPLARAIGRRCSRTARRASPDAGTAGLRERVPTSIVAVPHPSPISIRSDAQPDQGSAPRLYRDRTRPDLHLTGHDIEVTAGTLVQGSRGPALRSSELRYIARGSNDRCRTRRGEEP